jgi:tight adherence protein C
MDSVNTFGQAAGSFAGYGVPAMVLLTLIFVSVVLVVTALGELLASRGSMRRRLETEGAPIDAASELSIRFGDGNSAWHRLLEPLQKRLTPGDDVRSGSTRMRLVQAGYMRPSAVGTFHAVRLLSAVGLVALLLLFLPVLLRAMPVDKILMLGGCAILVGLYLPPAWLSYRITRRQRDISEGFPDALDMMLVCVEAGLGLDAAINRVGQEIGKAHPVLGEQITLVGLELRAGKPRAEALRNLADRTGIDEVRSLVTLLIQSDSLGSSIAQSLRVHAEDMRLRRMLKAEEKAHKLPVKLSIPLILCILPALMLVVLSPAILRIVDTLIPNLRHIGH